jgi:molybdenum-dependent DNA-binding transcriptional regulator ModE
MDCPVGYTCGSIDSAIEDAQKAYDMVDTASFHLNQLLGKYGLLEELRGQNEQLRSWGHEMQSKYDDLVWEYDKLLKENEELYEELESFKSKYL